MTDENERGFHSAFTWEKKPESQMAANLTWGTLKLQVGEETVWPGDFQWSWIELLEWLGLNWRDLTEEGLPFDLHPQSFEELEEYVQQQNLTLRTAWPDSDQEAKLWNFLQAHDLSKSLEGADYFTCLIWREGEVGYVITQERSHRLAWHELVRGLRHLGDEIVKRLEHFDDLDERAVEAINTWNAHF